MELTVENSESDEPEDTAMEERAGALVDRIDRRRAMIAANSGRAVAVGALAVLVASGGMTIWMVYLTALIIGTAFRSRNAVSAIGLGLVLGGALGNLADRALRGPAFSGHVVDFIDLHWWPVFNVADGAIVIGAVILAWTSFRDERAARAAAGAPDDAA